MTAKGKCGNKAKVGNIKNKKVRITVNRRYDNKLKEKVVETKHVKLNIPSRKRAHSSGKGLKGKKIIKLVVGKCDWT